MDVISGPSLSHDKMYCKILISLSLLSLCKSDKRDQAISSMSFYRKDLPLSYNFSLIHNYTTETPETRGHKRPQPREIKNIQFAPIPLDAKEEEIVHAMGEEMKQKQKERKIPTEPQNSHSSIGKSYLSLDAYKPYVVGHNMEIVRKPVQQLESLQESDYNRLNKNHENRQISAQQYYRPALKQIVAPTVKPLQPSYHNHHHQAKNVPNEDILNNELSIQSALQKLQSQLALNSFYRLPRVKLNEARSYNIANLLHKAPTNIYNFRGVHSGPTER